MTNEIKYQIGLVIYPQMTQLDILGPHQVFTSMPNTQVHILWKTKEPVTSGEGLTIVPTTTFSECPTLDVLCIGGGDMGQVEMMRDREMLEFLALQGKKAKYVTSVCTGSLILAAAGLLQGYRAATHWLLRDHLARLGVEVGTERVVVDNNRITGGGVTAGIDFGLVVAAKLCGEETAKAIQLILEYNPAPPFNAGSPETAGEILVDRVKKLAKGVVEASLAQIKETTIQVATSK